MIRFSNGAGIEDAHTADHLIAWDMGVSMQEKIGFAQLRKGWGNMDQAESQPIPRVQNLHRQGLKEIVIPLHDGHRRAESLDAVNDVALADIAEMPDFVRRRNISSDRFRKRIVGVGNDSDPKLLARCLHGRMITRQWRRGRWR